VVPAERAGNWIDRLLSLKALTGDVAVAVAQIGALTDDARRDIDGGRRAAAIERLSAAGFDREMVPLARRLPAGSRDPSHLFGESLPLGLVLTSD
jgi:hypothetical protein